MAWIYLAESEDYQLLSENGSSQLPTVKSTDTHSRCCCQEWPMGNYLELPSGMILHRLLAPCYQLSISYMEGSHAKTSVLLDLEKAWMESEADYSLRFSGLQPTLNLPLFSLKMSQPLKSLCHKSGPSLRDLGMNAAMVFARPRMSELCIRVKDGSLLPTLTASEGGYNKSLNSRNKRGSLTTLVSQQYGLMLSPQFAEWFMGYAEGWTELSAWAMQWFRAKPKKPLNA